LLVKTIVRELQVQTEGLKAHAHPEIMVQVADSNLLGEAEEMLLYIAKYISECNTSIKANETMSYGYWLLEFRQADVDLLEVWECNLDATELTRGANLALQYWRDQHQVCEKFGGLFSPPIPDRLAVISEGVIEGEPVQGIRYPSPEHMSGWWVTTDRYNGKVDSLRTIHMFHLTSARPDLAPYISLPYGFRFDLSDHEDVWYDENVAKESPL
jgi:hypothetical protein